MPNVQNPPFKDWRHFTRLDLIRRGLSPQRADAWNDNPCACDENGEPTCPGWCFITDSDGHNGRIERCNDCCVGALTLNEFDDEDAARVAAYLLRTLLYIALPVEMHAAVTFLSGIPMNLQSPQ